MQKMVGWPARLGNARPTMLLGCVLHHATSGVIISHLNVNAVKCALGGHLSGQFLCFLAPSPQKGEGSKVREGKGGGERKGEGEKGTKSLLS